MDRTAFDGRLEGAAKVTGSLVYEGDVAPPGMLHAALVESRIARGRVLSLDDSQARRCAGFVDMITPAETQGLRAFHATKLIREDEIHSAGQGLAIMVAETRLQAWEVARSVVVGYDESPPVTSLKHPDAAIYAPQTCGARGPAATLRGDPAAALASAPHVLRQRYETAANNHHPMEPHVGVCWWEDDDLIIHTSTQAVFGTRTIVAHAFDLPRERVRVFSPFLGGGFGCKGALWFPWLLWTIIAARRTGRPVRLEHTRAQLFTLEGRRSATVQDLAIGADNDGRLLGIDHRVLAQTSTHTEYADSVASVSQWVYSCTDVRTEHRLAPTNEPHAIPMRGPGEAPGSFAFESALDELARELAIDPVELRLRNIADHDQMTGLPWSSNSLAECLRRGAARFGWRSGGERGWREGGLRVGRGVGVAFYPALRQPCAMRVRLDAEANAVVECGTQDMGSGTYSTIGQMAAEALGLPVAKVTVIIGDTLLPQGPISAGSQVTQSFAPAVMDAVADLKRKVAALLGEVGEAEAAHVAAEELQIAPEGLVHCGASNITAHLADLLAHAGLDAIEGNAFAPGLPAEAKATGMGFGAVFAEVAVDPVTAMARVRRMTAAFAAGRIVNPTLARSQYISGLVGGLGMALQETTLTDPRSGRIVGASFAEYLVPTCADMPAFDIVMVDEVDDYLPEGVKGVGMLGHVGSAAAIANAIHQATGRRIRHLPIRVEDLL